MPKNAISRLYGRFSFSFDRNLQTLFQRGSTISHSHLKGVCDLVSPHPHQQLILSLFFTSTVLIDGSFYFSSSFKTCQELLCRAFSDIPWKTWLLPPMCHLWYFIYLCVLIIYWHDLSLPLCSELCEDKSCAIFIFFFPCGIWYSCTLNTQRALSKCVPSEGRNEWKKR